MKHVFIFSALVIFSLASYAINKTPAPVLEPNNKKVVQTFHEVFQHAENVVWAHSHQLYEASFTSDAVRVTALLDKNGNLIRTLKYYKEDDLPSNILFQIKKQYHTQQVWGVTEVSEESGIYYFIILRDDAHWYHLKADGQGEIELQSKAERGDI